MKTILFLICAVSCLAANLGVNRDAIMSSAYSTTTEAQAGTTIEGIMSPARVAQYITATLATTTEAQTGTDNTKLMTPLRSAQGASASITAILASTAEAIAGTDNTKLMTPIRTAQAIGALNPFWKLFIAQDKQTSGTAGGTFTAGAWVNRALNHVGINSLGATFSDASDEVYLGAGSYFTMAFVPAFACDSNEACLYNLTSDTIELLSSSCFAASTHEAASVANIMGFFELAAASSMEIRHICGTTRASDGLGKPCFMGTSEIYTQLMILQID